MFYDVNSIYLHKIIQIKKYFTNGFYALLFGIVFCGCHKSDLHSAQEYKVIMPFL